MIDTGEILKRLADDTPLTDIKIVSLMPTVEGALLVVYEKPNYRGATNTNVACFKRGEVAWISGV